MNHKWFILIDNNNIKNVLVEILIGWIPTIFSTFYGLFVSFFRLSPMIEHIKPLKKKLIFLEYSWIFVNFSVFLSVFRPPTLCAAPPKYVTYIKWFVLTYCIFWRQPLTVGKRGAKFIFQKHRFYVGESCVGLTKILETTPDECKKLRILSRAAVRPILVRSHPRIFS